jgi:uncharacterized protein (DUF58 family)
MRSDRAVPLVPRRRVAGLPHGTLRASRRGAGVDLVGARPYSPGDDVRRIDHRASARRSSQPGHDVLLVREFLTEEAARIVAVADRRPSMGLFPDELPWLHKPRALAAAAEVLAESALAARCPLGYADDATWAPPDGRAEPSEVAALLAGGAFRAAGGLERAVERLLGRERTLPAGTFVFLLSDFLEEPPRGLLLAALARGWDVVPVVLQDPLWEQSFPALAGATVPVADPAGGRTRLVRFGADEVERRRAANEGRLRRLLDTFSELGLDHVLVGDERPAAVLSAFTAWAAGRRAGARLL